MSLKDQNCGFRSDATIGRNDSAAKAVEARTAELKRAFDAKSARVSALEAQLGATRAQLEVLADRVSRLEQH